MNQTDEQLVSLYLEGDGDALKNLFERHLKPIYRFIFGFIHDDKISADLTQDTFVKAWKGLKKFDTNKSFKTWIYTIAKNTVFDYFRQKKSILFSDINDEINYEENIVGDTFNPEQIFEIDEDSTIIKNAIMSLPIKQQLVIVSFYFNELSLSEISNISGESVNTIKSRQFRGIRNLKEILENKTNN